MGEPPGWATFCAFSASHPHRVPTQAAANLEEMDGQGLEQYAEVLDMENPDLYKWLTGQAKVPDEVWPAASVCFVCGLGSSALSLGRRRLKTTCCDGCFPT